LPTPTWPAAPKAPRMVRTRRITQQARMLKTRKKLRKARRRKVRRQIFLIRRLLCSCRRSANNERLFKQNPSTKSGWVFCYPIGSEFIVENLEDVGVVDCALQRFASAAGSKRNNVFYRRQCRCCVKCCRLRLVLLLACSRRRFLLRQL